MHRRSTGIERITRELFSADMLAPLPVETVEASRSRFGVVTAQNLTLPLGAMRHRNDVFLFPGFPPSPWFSLACRERTVMYVHDVFLLTRRAELNMAARYYFAPLFALAVRSLRHFLVNSDYTASTLRAFCRDDATIVLCRPNVRNVFGLDAQGRGVRNPAPSVLTVTGIGTVEPRKNFRAAAEICAALSARLGVPVNLQIIGRPGWGSDAAFLSQQPHVRLLGALPDAEVRAVVAASDLFICTSRDEGLGLPLLEAQYAGLPVIAPDMPVFREALGSSGFLIDPQDARSAAAAIASLCSAADWRAEFAQKAAANIARWNALARVDQRNVYRLFETMLAAQSGHSSTDARIVRSSAG